MMLDDRMLDLLERWEESARRGQNIEVTALAAGDPELATRLRQHVGALNRMVWLQHDFAAGRELSIPSPNELQNALLLPDDLDLATFQANLAKAELPDPAALAKLMQQHRVKNAYQLANLLLESELLTRFQLRAISRGRTRGLRLGRYIILDKIGEGGMGQVYKARHSRMDRDVAIKVLPREAMNKENGVERFYQEVQVAAVLRHRNIVTAYDADEGEGLHFLVMEYVNGRDLHSIVRRDGPLSPAKAVDFILQAAQGLQYAHGVGLVHRDIKPANLLLNDAGVVKILDMGIARLQDSVDMAGLTQNGAIMGTVDYMSPEQAVDAKTVTPQADLYSLGCTLYYLLTGRPPFGGDTFMAKLLCHRQQSPPSLLAFRSDIPPSLDAILHKCLAKLPADRYADAAALIADLENVRPQLSDVAGPKVFPPTPEENVDTAPTGVLATLAYVTENAIPTLTFSPKPAAPAEAQPQRRKTFAKGGVAIGVSLCVLMLFGALAVFSFSTPDGSVVIEADEDQYVAHLRGRELKLVNEKTQIATSIQLLNTQETKALPPGDYKIALESRDGLKTDVGQVTIAGGTTSKVKVFWEDAATLAKRAANPIPEEPATPAIETTVNMATNPAPPVSVVDNSPSPSPPTVSPSLPISLPPIPSPPAVPPATPPCDYDSFAKGEWIPLITDQEELDRLMAERKEPVHDYEHTYFRDGVVTTDSANIEFPTVKAKNFLYRARLKRDIGRLGILRAKQTQQYCIFWGAQPTNFFLGKNVSGSGFTYLKNAQASEEPPEFFEFAMAGIGRTLIIYVEGKELFRFDRPEEPSDQLQLGFGTHRNIQMAFKEIQWMALADDAVVPALPGLDEQANAPQQDDSGPVGGKESPDYVAAKRILSLGGSVTVNGRYITSASQLPTPPFALTAFNISRNQNLTEVDLAPIAKCEQLEEITLFQDRNLNGSALAPLANCRNLRIVNLNHSPKVGSGLVHFANCEQLEKLQLWEVNISLADILPIADRNFRYLNLGITPVTDDWLPHFTQLDDLQNINLRYTQVTDKGLAHFQSCRKLRGVSLGRTRVTDAGLAYFRDCRSLEGLIVSETAISNASIGLITTFANLKSLEIVKTKITPAGVERLRKALPNCTIVWDGGTINPKRS